MQVVGDPEFFEEIADEASRLDRSQSWIIQKCLTASLPALATMAADADAITTMKKSPLRNPLRLQSLRVNLALAESDDPEVQDLATTPRGTESRTLYMPRALYEQFDLQGDRLKLSSDEILMWAWERNREEIRALSPVGE